MRVVPPGTDLSKFHPPRGDESDSPVAADIARFLTRPEKPMILALSRPDPRKNITTLVEAYGESPAPAENWPTWSSSLAPVTTSATWNPAPTTS